MSRSSDEAFEGIPVNGGIEEELTEAILVGSASENSSFDETALAVHGPTHELEDDSEIDFDLDAAPIPDPESDVDLSIAPRLEKSHQNKLGTLVAKASSSWARWVSLLGSVSAPGILLALGLFLKPFYLLPSGSFQLGDLAISLAFAVAVIKGGESFRIERNDLLLGIFVFAVLAINLAYFCIYQTGDFILQSLYYAFNLLAVLVFRSQMKQPAFLALITQNMRIDIVLQLVLYLVGAGRWHAGGEGRYLGTFNDPNQFAFYLFCAYLVIQILARKRGIKTHLADDAIVLFLVAQSASIGMMLGVLLALVPRVVQVLRDCFHAARVWHTLGILVLVAIVFLSIGFGISGAFVDGDAPVVQRIEDKLNKARADGSSLLDPDSAFITDRQLDKIILYPDKMLYGAGQGDFSRFEGTVSANEIHSSFPGMLWYYGIVPFAFLMAWVAGNFRAGRNDWVTWLYYLAFFIETCTLTNQRQPLFWFILMLGAV